MTRYVFTVVETVRGDWEFCNHDCLTASHLFDDFALLANGWRDGEVHLTNDEMWERGYREVACMHCGTTHPLHEPYFREEGR
jgi:hypothetical protein